MRISISNIAWDTDEDEQVAGMLGEHNVDAIDIAPGKYFPKPAETCSADIDSVRRWWEARGISIVGMQSLLFGTHGFNVFSSTSEQMLTYLGELCRVAGRLGSSRLVFGSPRNRDRTGLTNEAVDIMAKEFFRRLGDVAKKEGVVICLEPNPTVYGANFMTTCDETARMVRLIDHPAIGMQFDTGALAINNEDPHEVLSKHGELIRHIHVSEKNLMPLGDGDTDHDDMSQAAKIHLPEHIVTIEMRATDEEPHMKSIERAIQITQTHYGDHP